ncbi:S1 family peptidase [Humisphaera borealis]|uniref:Trypsin-like peptidase domain-containing protein n=1 Tax=Humisphaera borealis TaxID=2807512 RepID=A0A7M2WZ76_9BACT|nr:serine protease [Humisphaera borealis]QOV90786.1 trypsin-like peptidase domain-containing protein [Humisphaera borealis]
MLRLPRLPTLLLSALALTHLATAVFADGPALPQWADNQVRARLTVEGDKLKADSKTTEAKDLAAQLTRRDADVRLAKPSTGVLPGDKLYDAAARSTVVFSSLYKCNKCEHTHANAASGVIISADGIVATNYHVMANKEAFAFVAMTYDGKVYPVVEVLAADAVRDVALVKLGGARDLPAAPVRAGSTPLTDVVVMSHPDGRFFSITKGVVSRYFRRGKDGNGPVFMQITADYAKGSSGGPVLNTAGEVVGLVSSTNSVYYNQGKDGELQNLQMVFKDCVPADAILGLVKNAPAAK